MHKVTEELRTALVDRYLIESELGEGGMATVYLAHDVKHNRKVALKVLKPELAAMIGAERFLKEIEVTANLQHPHILPLHDSGEASGFLYYVMPYVEGETLRTKLEREKQFSIDQAIQLTRAIAGALDYAHRQGVIHRDIKPENILLVDGQPEVADFGIALAVSQAGGTRLTETGLSIGTPQYMSPEQAMGDRELDARSDVYSVGAMLYEMLTGDPPYMGSTAQAIVAKVITEKPPPVTAARDTVPPHVAAAVDKALAKLPADRFGSAAQLAEALVTPGFTSQQTMSAPAVPLVSTRPGRPMMVALAVAAIASALALWGWLRPTAEPPSEVTRFTISLPEDQLLQRLPLGFRFALSPDGRTLAYVGPGEDQPMLWLRRFDQLNATRVPGTEGAYDPSFSPDGQSLLFHVEQPRQLKLLSLVSGTVVTVADSALGTSGSALGDDGYLYADVDDGGLARLPRSGGTYETIVALDRDKEEIGVAWPIYLPGGSGVLYRMRYAGRPPSLWNIMATSLATGESKVVTKGVRAQYVEPGLLIYATGEGRLMAAPFDKKRLEITGPSQALIEGLTLGLFGVTEFAAARNGTLVYLTGGDARSGSELIIVDSTGTIRPAYEEWQPLGLPFVVAPEPGGTRKAMVISRGEEGGVDIYVKGPGERLPVRLSFDGTVNRGPRWSPDRQWVYFLSDRDGPNKIFRKRADGSGRIELVELPEFVPETSFDLGVSNGETWLVLSVQDEFSESDLVGVRLGQDTAFVPLLTGPDWQAEPALSPDGRWLAFSAGDSDSPTDRVFVRPFPDIDGGQWQISEGPGYDPAWAPDGRSIYYRDPAGHLIRAEVQTEPYFAVVGRREALGDARSFWAIGALYAPLPNGEVMLVGAQGAGEEKGSLVVVQNFRAELE